jgi:hypothetical protein
MGKGSIKVKLPVDKVIKALEQSLNKLELDWTSQEANEAKYKKAMEKWDKEVIKFAISHFNKAENVRTNYRAWNNTFNIDFDVHCDEASFPKQPERDFGVLLEWQYKQEKEEISNAIRILKMTDEETVNTSTFNAISKYL